MSQFQNPELVTQIRKQYGIDLTPKPHTSIQQPAVKGAISHATESEKVVYIGSVMGEWMASNLTDEQGELALKALAMTWQYRRNQKQATQKPKENINDSGA